ncbi:MAG TPA: Holliday junction resolvase RuvX [Candidatus Magasanikbacteria bacterium]|nr:Holliday junction resolvase RuvX [Candidatus Magasanikbacteria bacterium]
MNILGVDYGRKRIGLAWAQTGLDVVLPFGVVGNKDELIELIKKEKINKVIFGLPFGLEDSSENDNTRRIRKFAEEIKKSTNLEIDFADERLTTAEAEEMGGRASLDEKAAMLILEGYLEQVKLRKQ